MKARLRMNLRTCDRRDEVARHESLRREPGVRCRTSVLPGSNLLFVDTLAPVMVASATKVLEVSLHRLIDHDGITAAPEHSCNLEEEGSELGEWWAVAETTTRSNTSSSKGNRGISARTRCTQSSCGSAWSTAYQIFSAWQDAPASKHLRSIGIVREAPISRACSSPRSPPIRSSASRNVSQVWR